MALNRHGAISLHLNMDINIDTKTMFAVNLTCSSIFIFRFSFCGRECEQWPCLPPWLATTIPKPAKATWAHIHLSALHYQVIWVKHRLDWLFFPFFLFFFFFLFETVMICQPALLVSIVHRSTTQATQTHSQPDTHTFTNTPFQYPLCCEMFILKSW